MSTVRADIDYHIGEALTQYGKLGVKVWIMKGEVYGRRDLTPLVGQQKKGGPSSGGGNRGGGDRDNRRPSRDKKNN